MMKVQTLHESLINIVRKHSIKIGELREKQIVDLIIQLGRSCDLEQLYINEPLEQESFTQLNDGTKITITESYAVTYVPYREMLALKERIWLLEEKLAEYED